MSRATVMRQLVLSASLVAIATSTQLAAQAAPNRVMESGRTPRRYVLPWVGAAVGGVASLVYFWSGPRTLPGTCANSACVAAASLGGGAFVGWLVGKEKDELHALRYRGGQPLRPNTTDITLTGEPNVLAVGSGLVAAIGGGGVQLIATAGDRLRLQDTRASGLRGVSDAAIIESEALLGLTANQGFYRFPLAAGNGTQMRGAPATAVAVLGSDFVIAAGTRVERISRAATDTARWPGITLDDSVRAIDVDARGTVWAATATHLYALSATGDSLGIVSKTEIPRGSTTRVDVVGEIGAVALGDSGVRFISVANPAAPTLITDWRDTRYVYDVALHGNKVYAASGVDGVTVLSLTGTVAKNEGLMREVGHIVSVKVDGKYLWVLDRGGGGAAVRRVPLDPQ
jgi:hypothetical protein